MPRLSIVIPCLGGAAEFDGTLVSVLQHRPADSEILVLHTEPYDDPYALRGEVHFLRAAGRKQCVELINEAIAAAAGEIVHVIGCGLEATEGWTDTAVAHFDDPQVAAVSPLVLDRDGENLVSAGLRYSLGGTRQVVTDKLLLSPGTGRLRASILGPTLAAAFFRRDVLTALDGFDGQLGDRFADVDLALCLQDLGCLHCCEPASRLKQVISDVSASDDKAFSRGRLAQRLFWRHAAGRGLAASLALHPLSLAGDLAREGVTAAAASMLGRAVACCQIGEARRQQERIATAIQRMEDLAELQTTIKLPAARQSAEVTRRRAA